MSYIIPRNNFRNSLIIDENYPEYLRTNRPRPRLLPQNYPLQQIEYNSYAPSIYRPCNQNLPLPINAPPIGAPVEYYYQKHHKPVVANNNRGRQVGNVNIYSNGYRGSIYNQPNTLANSAAVMGYIRSGLGNFL